MREETISVHSKSVCRIACFSSFVVRASDRMNSTPHLDHQLYTKSINIQNLPSPIAPPDTNFVTSYKHYNFMHIHCRSIIVASKSLAFPGESMPMSCSTHLSIYHRAISPHHTNVASSFNKLTSTPCIEPCPARARASSTPISVARLRNIPH